MKEVSFLPEKLAVEGTKIAESFENNFLKQLLAMVVLTGASPLEWKILPLSIMLLIFRFDKIYKLLREYEPVIWRKIITLSLVLITAIEGSKYIEFRRHEDILFMAILFILTLPMLVVPSWIGDKAELAYYKSHGYIFKGHTGAP